MINQRGALLLVAIVAMLAGWAFMSGLAVSAGGPAAAEPSKTEAPRATITGMVSVTKGNVPPMIVYLEAVDQNRVFPPPRQPILVSQKEATFVPEFIVISVGQTVVFPNDEDRPIEHNVFSRSSAKQFDLGLYPPGKSKSITFDKPGKVRLFCSIHRYMDGLMFVCPTPFFSHVADDGRYRIANVPPGNYLVKTWQRKRRYREQSRPIEIKAGDAVTVDWELRRK